jgi:hypothetical protein
VVAATDVNEDVMEKDELDPVVDTDKLDGVDDADKLDDDEVELELTQALATISAGTAEHTKQALS